MTDLFTASKIDDELAQIREILQQFGLRIKVTHVNKMYCNEESKHFFGEYEGLRCGFTWFKTRCAYPDLQKEGVGHIRQNELGYHWLTLQGDYGNMVAVEE